MLKEESCAAEFANLEKDSLELKQKIETLLVENNKWAEKLKQVKLDLAANRRWNKASQALNWLNFHHNRGKNGFGLCEKENRLPCEQKICWFI